jgi:hypothetical protein
MHIRYDLLVYICIAVGDPIIKTCGWYLIQRFNPAVFLLLSTAMTWISNVTDRDLLTFNELG